MVLGPSYFTAGEASGCSTPDLAILKSRGIIIIKASRRRTPSARRCRARDANLAIITGSSKRLSFTVGYPERREHE
jgi:hypothetical protein